MSTTPRAQEPHAGLIASYLRELRREARSSDRRQAPARTERAAQVAEWRIAVSPTPREPRRATPE